MRVALFTKVETTYLIISTTTKRAATKRELWHAKI